MAKSVSTIITGSAQDVLAGTTVGVLPADSPSYEVEVRVASVNATTAGNVATTTLLVNGLSVLNQAKGFNNASTTDANYDEPHTDGPSALFFAAANSRLTLNITAASATDETHVYVEARESTSIQPLAIGHIDDVPLTASATELDILSGTNAVQVPSSGSLWAFTLQAVQIHSAATVNNNMTVTLLADSDTICENYRIPVSAVKDLREDIRVLIESLVSPGSRMTLNLKNGSTASRFFYRAYITPVS